jgi:DNA-binding response OmpR family regulator
MSILLADDDAQLATFLSKSLESEGYSVHTALDEVSVLQELKRQNYQLIILDLNFGETDGLRLLQRLRTEGLETPVMVLSARNHITDRLESFSLGADDYVTKPFSFQELAARANALLRRKTDPALSILRVEDLELDPATRKAHRGKREIKLSPKEFDLLALLLRHGGNTVSRQELLHECWGQELESDSNLVDVYVNYLRKKVDLPEDEKLIHTVRGEGYRLGRPASANKAIAGAEQPASGPLAGHSYLPYPEHELRDGVAAQPPLRATVHSVAHDLAQPLTSIRCFLEVLSLSTNLSPSQASDLKTIEQQADRAIALTKGISALVRENAPVTQPWIALDALLHEIFNDFSVLLHSGMLTVERHWDPSVHVTSNPLLRELLLLLFSKVAGRNTGALVLTVSASVKESRCTFRLAWKPVDASAAPLPGARTVLARDLPNLQQMAHLLGGEFSLREAQSEVSLTVPAAPAGFRPGFVH